MWIPYSSLLLLGGFSTKCSLRKCRREPFLTEKTPPHLGEAACSLRAWHEGDATTISFGTILVLFLQHKVDNRI